ncbi:phosphomethylpyrimidine synthase ThiC [Dyadobacter sp. OTU695]|uniref:phosphomethylpyrimidine synthase ThiC n=1 Tax=Dyadobacter sp. OTU695 TaxID=3043860 RepID=UPI00313D8828
MRNATLVYRNGTKEVGHKRKTLISVLTGATTSKDIYNQLRKIDAINELDVSERPDIISDLSVEQSKASIYKYIIANYPDYVVATLPIYQCRQNSGIVDDGELLSIIQEQIACGVGVITIHPTSNLYIMRLSNTRLVPSTSRGGTLVMNDLVKRNFAVENVYVRILDEIVKAAKIGRTTISIGASFRSANIFDSLDQCQLEEFKLQKEIADYISNRGVDVIIEGPGHSSPRTLKRIAEYYRAMEYPIMPLGPIPTDIAIGQDHISSAIGSTILGMENCVDIIAAVTREEHTGKIPSVESSIEAIRASKIAAHIIDLHKLGDYSSDRIVAEYRAVNQTCIYGKMNSGCSRCAHTCPLTSENFELA